MPRRSFSILIIVKGREEHLINTLAGVNAMTERPSEIVIVHMNQTAHPTIRSEVPLVTDDLVSTNPLPLAAARNRAAQVATTDTLLFLDVDCIPKPDYATKILDALAEFPGVVMGSPLYLPSQQPHPSLTNLPRGFSDDYNLFWSLCFAISRDDFDRVDGFDETFTGYGAEDTDFSWAARERGVRLAHCDANVLHQHHSSYRPPLNHFDDIVNNARVFLAKWNRWPMDGWLRAFVDIDLIEWTAESIDVKRRPAREEIDATRNDADF